MTARFFRHLVAFGLTIVGGFAACAPERHYVSTPEGAGGEGGAGNDVGSGKCTLGQPAQCAGLAPQRCSENGTWVSTQASCAVACLNGECVSCVEGTTTCKDGAVQKCQGGTLVTGQVCAKACQGDKCVDACTEGLFQCNGSRSLQKCVGGQFVDDSTCDFLCKDAACTGVCMPDTRRCNPAATNESQVCNADGNWNESVACPADTFCVNGDCKTCKPDSARCAETGPQLCSAAGEWVNQGACTSPNAACFQGKCVLCTPDDKRCNDQAVERCSADGTAWTAVETCSGDTPACLASTKACGKCSKGDKQCSDDALQTCDDSGAFQTTDTCSDATPQCVGGKCTECDPGVAERRCASPTSTQACSSTGSWATATDCSGDTPECREDLGFKCGCHEGATRCRNTTVPEHCEGGAWVAQTACSGTLDYCLPDTGACVDCVPKTAECRNGVAYQCKDDGSFESLNSCSGAGINCGNCSIGEPCSKAADCKNGFCVNNKCAVCDPGTRDCLGVTPRLCMPDGTWSNQTSCSGNSPVCLPSTGQCVACTNGDTRSCGNCNTGTQSCSNNQWGTCTGAVDLKTSKQYCGSCTTSCSSSQVCENGSCVVDCGNQTRCGTSCVNLATDTANCLSCGTKCDPPAAFGKAVCTSSGCDISCTNSRCGTSCCDVAPARSTAGCSGNSCTFTCSSGNHGCSGSSSPPCYSNTDASHCGSGCVDCSKYAGTTGSCSSNQCACEVSTFACGASVPTCGSWDFDSNTVEGWRFGDYVDASQHHWVGSLGTTTTNGSPALSATFDGSTDGGVAEFEVDLCPNTSILNLSSYVLTYDFYLLTTGGTRISQDPDDGIDTYLVNNRSVLTGCQPFIEPASETWLTGSCSNLQSSMTNITLVFRFGRQWKGNIFIDNVKFTPK